MSSPLRRLTCNDTPQVAVGSLAGAGVGRLPGGGGGGYFRNFWVGMCRWDPGTLSLYQSWFQLDFATLTIPEEELTEIESTAATMLQPRPTRVTRTRTSVEERMASQFAFDEGIARTVVTPQQSSADGPRRSGRTQTVISYNTE